MTSARLFLCLSASVPVCAGGGGELEAQSVQGRSDTTVFATPASPSDVRQVVSLARASGRSEVEVGPDDLIEVTWVTPAADGFAVVDRQSSLIGLFDERGQRSASVGSPGPGPGEFSRTIYHAVSVGNDLWVPDIENRRVNLIDISARAWVDSRPFNLALGFPQTWLSLPGDEIVGFIGSLGFGPEPNSSRVVRWTGESLEEAFSWTDEGEATGWAGATLVVPGPSKATVAILDRLGGGIRVHDLAGNIVSRYAFGEGAAAPLAVDDREYLEGLVADRRARRARDVARRVAQMEELAPEGARGAVTRMIADNPHLVHPCSASTIPSSLMPDSTRGRER